MKTWARPMGIRLPIDDKLRKGSLSVKELRTLGKERRDGLGEEGRIQKSRQAFQNLTALPEWQESQTVLTFASFGTEISTRELIQSALELKKAVYCPKVSPELKEMIFYRIRSISELISGFCGILEPRESGECYIPAAGCRTLMIVPGTVFDRKGDRIGYGGGYYDRYLGAAAKQDRPFLAGLCFECQLTDYIPAQSHDVGMDMVVTEKRVIRVPV